MSFLHKTIFFVFILALLFGCGNTIPPKNPNSNENAQDVKSNIRGSLTVSGKVTFDKIKVSNNYIGLNYNNVERVSVKNASIIIFDRNNNYVEKRTTDNNGEYTFRQVPSTFKIIVYANIVENNKTVVKVVDNTASNKPLYIMQTDTYQRNRDTILNINAPSGWDNDLNKYIGDRSAAPFAILNTIQKGMKKIKETDNNIIFPELVVNWSKNNKPATSFNALQGNIISSHFQKTEGSLWILGYENSDTDEYDESVIIHEWCHFFEDKLSRADNIGGGHNQGEKLDMRVAFSEGLGNSFSGIMLNNPNYYDTLESQQNRGWTMDISKNPHDNKGWYVEASIHSILYNLYTSYGLNSIYKTLVDFHPEQIAFLSIFTFIKGFIFYQGENVDNFLSTENISPITSIYGLNRSNNPLYKSESLYTELRLNESENICAAANKSRNKLGNFLYGYFTIPSNGEYQILNNNQDLAKFNIYQIKDKSLYELDASRNIYFDINAGKYIFELNNISRIDLCFNIRLKKKE